MLSAGTRKYGICEECETSRTVVPVKGAVCTKCGKPIGRADEYCADCKKIKHSYVQGKSVFLYEGNMKKSMYRFKYSNRRAYARFYARAAKRLHGAWIDRIAPDMIVPIPLHDKKLYKRGYNQAESFAKALGDEVGIPVSAKALKRVNDTRPQKYLGRQGRKKNLENAFIIGGTVVKSNCIMLVDDIYTTGSTMDAAAKVLLDAGASRVYMMTVCTGRPTEDSQGGL